MRCLGAYVGDTVEGCLDLIRQEAGTPSEVRLPPSLHVAPDRMLTSCSRRVVPGFTSRMWRSVHATGGKDWP